MTRVAPHVSAEVHEPGLSLAALDDALRLADPAALLVPPRILRRVIKHDAEISGIGLRVPHRKTYVIDRQGDYVATRLGRSPATGALPLVVVPGGFVFGATVDEPDTFALAGCTVAPGFDFADFHLPTRAELLGQYPQHRDLVERLAARR